MADDQDIRKQYKTWITVHVLNQNQISLVQNTANFMLKRLKISMAHYLAILSVVKCQEGKP